MVAAARQPSVAKQSFGDKRVPKLELGNELEIQVRFVVVMSGAGGAEDRTRFHQFVSPKAG